MHPEGFDATEDDVRGLLERDWELADRPAVEAVLAAVDHVGAHSTARVQVAILLCAEGSWERLEQFVALAAQDPRDVLAAAFYPDA